jgi:hypothetical protein
MKEAFDKCWRAIRGDGRRCRALSGRSSTTGNFSLHYTLYCWLGLNAGTLLSLKPSSCSKLKSMLSNV